MEKKQQFVQTVDYEGKKCILFDLEFYCSIVKIFFFARKYANGNLAVEVMNLNDDGYIEPWSVVTVNLGLPLLDGYAYADTNNNGWILGFVRRNGLASPTGVSQSSGFCVYPLMKWNVKKFHL